MFAKKIINIVNQYLVKKNIIYSGLGIIFITFLSLIIFSHTGLKSYGFTDNLNIVNTLTSLVFLSVLIIQISISIKTINIKPNLYLIIPNLFITLFFIAGNFYFGWLEKINFPNFVYSRYHINLSMLTYVSFWEFLIFIFLITQTNIFSNKKNHLQKVNLEYYLRYMIIAVLIFIIILNVTQIPSTIKTGVDSIKKVNSNPNLRQMFDFPRLLNQLIFISKVTKPNSTIVHPDQSLEHPVLGNQVLIRYILHPRILVSYSQYHLYSKVYLNNDVYKIFEPPITKKDMDEISLCGTGNLCYVLKFNGSSAILSDDNYNKNVNNKASLIIKKLP